MRHQRAMKRLSAIAHYSDGLMCCACCGEDHIQFLSIDHINGGGTKHRQSISKSSSSSQLYSWIKKNNYPPGFQVLCHNCNMAKGFYGKCPHESE